MLFPVEEAFVGRDEKRAPLKTPAWEASTILILVRYLVNRHNTWLSQQLLEGRVWRNVAKENLNKPFLWVKRAFINITIQHVQNWPIAFVFQSTLSWWQALFQVVKLTGSWLLKTSLGYVIKHLNEGASYSWINENTFMSHHFISTSAYNKI